MGDQRYGRNLEAPEGLIREIVHGEMEGFATVLANIMESRPMEITLNADVDEGVLFRSVKKMESKQGYKIGGVFAYAY